MDFNEKQIQAINHKDGSCMVIAAAGSGKSTTLLERISNMIESGVNQEDILAISFTNASATELKNKLSNKGLDDVAVGTFHSICRNILLKEGATDIMSFPNRYKVKREMEQSTGIKDLNIEEILSFISYQKSHGISPYDTFMRKDSSYSTRELTSFYISYEDFKGMTGTCDFDDWLLNTIDVCTKNKGKHTWKYLLADECQDLNTLHHKLIDLWCPSKNVFIVGDLNQSIYAWNGAVPELFKSFPDRYSGTNVINMNINYRSAKNIVENANSFIREYNIGYKYYEDAIPFKDEDGEIYTKLYDTRQSEAIGVRKKIQELIASGVNENDIAILYRNNAHSDYVESELKQHKIGYKVFSNNSFFERKEIKGIIAILRLIQNANDDEAFETVFKELRCYPVNYYKGEVVDDLISISGKRNCSLYEAFLDYNFPIQWQKRNGEMFVDFIGRLKLQNEKHLSVPKIIENIVKIFKIRESIEEKYQFSEWSDKMQSIENLKALCNNMSLDGFLKFIENGSIGDNKSNKDGVSLMTCHKSKGLEYDYVFVIGLEEDKFPSKSSPEVEEARLFYVAVTRAKKWMTISSIGESYFYNKYNESKQ